MATDSKTVRHSVRTDAFESIEIHVASLAFTEAIDEPYAADVVLQIHDPDADVLELLGRNVELTIERGDSMRRICGIAGAVFEGEPAQGFVVARVIVHPAFWMLSMRRNTRMFQDMSVPEIVESVLSEGLGDYGREARLEVEGDHPQREYCMQYQETDLAFVQRLLAEAGIFYTFDHEGEVEVMVLADTNEHFERAPTVNDPLPHHSDTLQAWGEDRVRAFSRRHAHGTTSVVLRDFDWTHAAPVVEDEERGEDAAGRDRESYEHGLARGVHLAGYDPGAGYQENDARSQAVRRLESHRRDEVVGLGVSDAVALAPGTTFSLSGHPHVGLDGEYYVTRVWHRDVPFDDDRADAEAYHNRFECRPIDVPHRPLRRYEKPSVASIQTAIVTGPSGEEIHTDEHGRVKVQFHWDRQNPADETSSCWVRCEQAWASSGWGFWWLPRLGMEVIVHFMDGDPDRPLVTGCVYNAANPPPYPLPDEKTKSTIKSSSSPGGDGFNELRFEDKAGSEEIFSHAQKDYNEVVLNDHTTTVHHDQTNEVDNDQTQSIGNDQTETVHQNQEMSVGGNRVVHVKGNFDETVDGTETRHTVGDVTESFGANETRDVSASLTETISGDETRSIGGNKSETVGGNHSLTVAAASSRTISGSLTQSITGGITETAPAGYNIDAAGGMTVTTTGPTNWTATGGITLVASGGVTWVDSFDFWFGTITGWSGPTSYNDYAIKMEYCDTAVGACGLKCEQAGFSMGNKGSKQIMSGVVTNAKGIGAAYGALRKRVSALRNRGG
ncbi:MAG TPA: type VI secretion system tip protein TssI/VgrG [Sandaracinaceae bacterium LLY-WYZ-13_1]|nr:type VI secretion system tip protein TssI/VgrG [Sandaracinaceae bacterium LLY-WYZ-13_1]